MVHKLDWRASGALLLTYVKAVSNSGNEGSSVNAKGDTIQLVEAMQSNEYIKACFIVLEQGGGILHGEELKTEDWFEVSRPMKDNNGKESLHGQVIILFHSPLAAVDVWLR